MKQRFIINFFTYFHILRGFYMHFDYKNDAPLDFSCKSFISRERLCRHRDIYMGRAAASLAVYTDGVIIPSGSDAAEYLYRLPMQAMPRHCRRFADDIRDSAAEYICHRAFFSSICAAASPSADAMDAVAASFGSMEHFRFLFTDRAAAERSPGCLWICRTRRGRLKLVFCPGYTLPHPSLRRTLCLDLWEHAYTEAFGCDRAAYAASFLSCADFSKLEGGFAHQKK